MKFIAIKKISIILSVFSSAIMLNSASGQELSKSELETRAMQYFKSSQYEKAATDFEVLYEMFPKDSRLAYYLGRSYFQSNQNLDKATELLKFAATRNYGTDTYYYLARAYHLNYKFEDAALAFLTFKKTSASTDIKKYNIDYWITVSENARESVKVARKIMVENAKSVPVNAVEGAFDGTLGGNYIYVPNEFLSSEDIELNYQSLMFLSNSSQIGDYIYFSSNSKKGKRGIDLFRVQILSAENFSLAEPLPNIINTEYDEAYPFFDKSSSTLYFSSKGHNTIGGYDIFMSSYDTIEAGWSLVERLDFPVNTTNDEILYSVLNDTKKSTFLSNRGTGLNEYIAYTIAYDHQVEYTIPQDRKEVMAYAMFNNDIEPDNVNLVYQKYEQGTLTQEELSKVQYVYNDKAEYEHLLTEALILQSQSDSLAWMAKELKTKIVNENDEKKKQILIANNSTIEQESKRLQVLADKKFLLAEQKIDPVEVEIQKDQDQNIQIDNNINGITLFSFSSSSDQNETALNSDDDLEYNKGREAAKRVSSEFIIQQSSPYSATNPIPMASLPGGLMYKIQLGSFSQAVPENTFGGLTPVSKEAETSAIKYYVGNFSSLKEARKALEQVKSYGYPDAFIVSFNNSEKINIQKAKEIEFAKN